MSFSQTPAAHIPGLAFNQIGTSSITRPPNAPIRPVKVAAPNRGDFGTPNATPTIAGPNRADYGLNPEDTKNAKRDLGMVRGEALKAGFGFRNPTKTGAFKNLMGLAGEQTAAQAGEQSRHASDAAQRRGYAGGFEDTARTAASDRMSALATAGFAGAQQVQQAEGEQYGRAIGAFTNLQDSYNQAMTTGNTAFAKDLTETHIQQAQAQLSTMQLNQQQQLEYGKALNDARQMQAQLDEQFNKDQIDNHRYIQANQQIAAQLAASMATLHEKSREFDVSTGLERDKMTEDKRRFDLGLEANPSTATRTFADPRFGANQPRSANPSDAFRGLIA